jgi:hypothetical protein
MPHHVDGALLHAMYGTERGVQGKGRLTFEPPTIPRKRTVNSVADYLCRPSPNPQKATN